MLFMALPLELRFKIYPNVLSPDPPKPLTVYHNRPSDPVSPYNTSSLDCSIRRTTREIYLEALPIPSTSSTIAFDFTHWESTHWKNSSCDFVNCINSRRAKALPAVQCPVLRQSAGLVYHVGWSSAVSDCSHLSALHPAYAAY